MSDLERSLKLSASDPSQAALIRGKLQEAKDGVSAMRAAETLQGKLSGGEGDQGQAAGGKGRCRRVRARADCQASPSTRAPAPSAAK